MIKKLPTLRILLATASATLDGMLHSAPDLERVLDIVAHARDTTELQSQALAFQPDAIVLDAALPGAWEAAGALLHLTLRQSCLLVIEASDSSDDLIRWLHVGATDILPPPLAVEQIVTALIRACDISRSALLLPKTIHVGEDTAPVRLLLVSKSSGAAERLAIILNQSSASYAVDQADTLTAAVERATCTHYAITLIDADQFGSGTFDIAARLRDYAPATCVVLLAAHADADRLRLAAQYGIRDYLCKPPTLDRFRMALARAHTISAALTHAVVASPASVDEPRPRPSINAVTRRGQVFTVYSPGGGYGCTALACGLALLLRRYDRRAALVDADLQFGNAAELLGLPASVTLDQITARIAFLRWPEEELVHHRSGLHVLPAPIDVVRGAMISVDGLNRLVQRLRTHYEAVVIDAPHALNDHSVRLLKIADHILMPVRSWETHRRRLEMVCTLLKTHGSGAHRLHLVQSGFNALPDLHAAAVINLDVLAAQLAAGDEPDLTGLEPLLDQLLAQ